MERDILKDLLEWKSRPNHKPAMIRGVRQCGKTWVMMELGKSYPDCAYFNFEIEAELSAVFEPDLRIDRIVTMLGGLRGRPVGTDCLIIFDEIQLCSRAITALKYFCEDGRFDVICAGSLLGVKLMTTSPPVGKVDDFNMYPLSFKEFLRANGQGMIVDALEEDPAGKSIGIFRSRLEPLYTEYLCIGGLPEVVSEWVANHDASAVDRKLGSLIERYILDILRYGEGKVKENGEFVWRSVPAQLARDNSKFVLGHVSKGARARDLWSSIDWLGKAELVYRVPITTGLDLPSIQSDPSSFKLYCFDTGIMRHLAGLSIPDAISGSERLALYRGAMAENYVLCEIIKICRGQVYCWRSGNSAEVDFLASFGSDLIPIEVKSGDRVRAKSLGIYLDSHPGKGVVASLSAYSQNERVISVPLFALWLLPKILARQS